ncbi:sigma-54 dependent transcriptional regulator [bacterium]|nr:sigma-54 dependent transcriptional regulator [bacterium]MBU1065906.1 sigma-54 dependent transcriptional regulator [bacterium]MBU1633450.1 sigma-54 dependent transcriptional regulator [bacterium]MBU1873893.1 sigma-54 dependent transcriptional regulator [bacterium]
MQNDIIHLLVIEDEKYDVDRIVNTLKPYESKIQIKDVVKNGYDALNCIKTKGEYDVVILDYQISGGLYGEALIRKLKDLDPTLQILVITKMTINQTDPGFANKLLESGAYWYGTKYPGDIEDFIYQPTDFVLSIMNAYALKQSELAQHRIQRRLDKNINAILSSSPLLGQSSAIQKLQTLIEKFAKPNASVFIIGDSGTGKELIATNIHYKSARRYEVFLTINCAAIPKDLIESELFGYEKGSFTGANENKPGLFEQAHGGTLFLDEVTELPPSAQAKLLRVLQEGEIAKIGRQKTHYVDVRVIAASNKNIDELLKKKELREDLYYRLNILQIKVPPLKERIGDVPILVKYFIDYYRGKMGVQPLTVSLKALKILEDYSWPGNVRQLKNVVQRMAILANHTEITKDLVESCMEGTISIQPEIPEFPDFSAQHILTLKEMDKLFRCKYIEFVRRHSRTDMESATKLGMAPSNFHRMCKELGIKE